MAHPSASSEPSPAERRFERQMEEARECLPPEWRSEMEDSGIDPQHLSALLVQHLAALPPEQRRALRRRIAVAASDIEGLIGELEQDLAGLAADLRALSRHRGAAQAYMTRAMVRHDRSS